MCIILCDERKKDIQPMPQYVRMGEGLTIELPSVNTSSPPPTSDQWSHIQHNYVQYRAKYNLPQMPLISDCLVNCLSFCRIQNFLHWDPSTNRNWGLHRNKIKSDCFRKSWTLTRQEIALWGCVFKSNRRVVIPEDRSILSSDSCT